MNQRQCAGHLAARFCESATSAILRVRFCVYDSGAYETGTATPANH